MLCSHFLRDMHTKSALLDAIKQSTVDGDDAKRQTLAFLKEHIKDARTVPLCGNSIGTDRRFLATQWPEIEDFLHYRSIDVSTIKELARRWAPQVHKGFAKESTHTAMSDVRDSIAELRYYRQFMGELAGDG